MLEKHFMTIPYMVKSFILILIKNSMVVAKSLFFTNNDLISLVFASTSDSNKLLCVSPNSFY